MEAAMKRILNLYKICLLLSALLGHAALAQTTKILIINSDDSVYKYQEIASEFKKMLPQPTYAWTEFNIASYPDDAEDKLKQLVEQSPVDLIYCIGTKAYSLARQVAETKKLLFAATINWRRLGISANSYGVANELAPAQEVSLLRYFFPRVKKIGLLYNDAFSRQYIDTIKQETASLGVSIVSQTIDAENDIRPALLALLPKVDIFWIISDPVLLSSHTAVQSIFDIAKQQQKPVYAYSDVFIEQGAALTISADMATIGRQSANLVSMITDQKLSAGMVQIPAGSTITLNKCLLDSLPIELNQDALDSVNQLINCPKPVQ
jgi:putative ABC transport system substrate-binding protein